MSFSYNYIYQYDVAALFISLIILLNFLLQKKISTKITTAFEILAGDLVFATIMDLITVYTLANYDKTPVELNIILNIIALLSYNLLPALFYYCIYSATNYDKKSAFSDNDFLTLIPIIIAVLLILTTPFTNFIFYFDDIGRYHSSKYFDILSVIGFVYLIMVIIQAIRKRDLLNRMQVASIILYTISTLVSIIIQIFFPRVLISLFFASLTILLVYLTLDNPSDYIDQTMGIYNKKAFMTTLQKLFDNKKMFKVICIQLEGIVNLNDTIGYSNFNKVLIDIRNKLTPICGRKNLFRLSGSKLALIFIENGSIINRLHEIKSVFNNQFHIQGMAVSIRIKMTTILCPKEASDPQTALDLLFFTLESPNTEVGIVTKADNLLLEKAKRETKLVGIMRKSLQNNRFSVFYQPIYSVKEKKFKSAEALVRLNNTELGFISPDEFIPLAEKNGLILELGEYVFKSVCEFIALNKIWENGIEFIQVNLSAIQCMQEKLHELLCSIMDSYHLNYKYIRLEVSETAAKISSEGLKKNMDMLKTKNIFFALDDFGIGLQDTANLLNYPFETVKIDKSLLWAAVNDDKSKKIVEHSISMLKDMGLEVIVEGVETEEMAEMLKQMNCDYFQGFLYSKPIKSQDFLTLIQQ